MSSQQPKQGGGKRNRKGRGQKKQEDVKQAGKGPKKDTKAQQQPKAAAKKAGDKKQQQRKQKEKVSTGEGRKRKTTKGGQTKGQQAIDIAQQRLELIIRSKYQNPAKTEPTKLESQICQFLVDLEASNKDLKHHLRHLGIVMVREIAITPTKKAIVIFVPYKQHARWQKLQDRLVRELEKKFSDQEVLLIAQRKVMKLCQIDPRTNAPRPRTQTITAVQNAILNDVVYPTKIVGKRTRFRVGGKRLLKVYLDPKDAKDIESRIQTYETVYRKLTKKNVKFLFPRYVI
mmetsp:Transcript_22742/g.36516  ORF Transcript_22742/g.36516 Transcript_22742/m.36516 type:complete len:287 (-) Transcript_22742:53-913(-)|eukprot:CAMPEP_0202686068 /NCGR_PEP_ID=MMETSP1385-20130828/1857_1 /ASSEMBLY_ACC=CAM_ASM_000861 /TAXON_ID=933848 /ORGANISM="Elphidium margaritaceum" /LENGTH=286 /DNA_ID=CAMNT_0049340571 /DNA_START=77 /DNA_END=937 /DNA_ORIENTATION=-